MQNRSKARKEGQRENVLTSRKDTVSLNKFELEAARLRAIEKKANVPYGIQEIKACVCVLIHKQIHLLGQTGYANLVLLHCCLVTYRFSLLGCSVLNSFGMARKYRKSGPVSLYCVILTALL